ncbi:MAG: dihydrofolate reductase [Candidatus Wildermuthbacteria bacterium]|nr:dihydrofolate reductase [Candidatus Wildermuthbacteria bacterium]
MKTFIIAALTADGFIARHTRHFSLEWTSPEEAAFFRTKTRGAVVVMGSTSYSLLYEKMKRGMPNRLNVVYTSNPEQFAGHNIETTQKPPAELITDLRSRGYENIAIIGGSTIYTMFLKAGVVDRLYLSIEPILFGKGITLFNEDIDQKLLLENVEHLNENTLSLTYSVIK